MKDLLQPHTSSVCLITMVQPGDGDPTLAIPALSERVNREDTWAKDVRGHKEPTASRIQILAYVGKPGKEGEGR